MARRADAEKTDAKAQISGRDSSSFSSALLPSLWSPTAYLPLHPSSSAFSSSQSQLLAQTALSQPSTFASMAQSSALQSNASASASFPAAFSQALLMDPSHPYIDNNPMYYVTHPVYGMVPFGSILPSNPALAFAQPNLSTLASSLPTASAPNSASFFPYSLPLASDLARGSPAISAPRASADALPAPKASGSSSLAASPVPHTPKVGVNDVRVDSSMMRSGGRR